MPESAPRARHTRSESNRNTGCPTGIGTRKAEDQLAPGAIAGNDHGSIVAAAQRVLAKIEAEAGLLLALPVTPKTFGCEDRLDVLVVINRQRGRWREFSCVLGLEPAEQRQR